jgi:hypothetical protein
VTSGMFMQKFAVQVQGAPSKVLGHTTQPPAPHLVLVVLHVLKKNFLAGGRAQTAEDVWEQARHTMPPGQVVGVDVESILQELHSVAVVRRSKSTRDGRPVELWEPGSGWRMDLQGDGGDHDVTSTDDPSGPRRFPEVLAHPILFALQQEEFDELLDQMLQE